MIYRFFIFLVVNFAALGIGGMYTGKGVPSDWYQVLNKAPWTPPGWVFGAAWTIIMICFAFYMAYAWKDALNTKNLLLLFLVQLILNVLWNPIFFKYHNVLAGLIVISALTIVVSYFLFGYISQLKLKTLFIMPYFIWLLIAVSLNAYIYIKN